MDKQTQDILHHIELKECTLFGYACLAMSLKRIRRCRRQAKKRQRVFGSIRDWIEQNQKYIKGLEKLLGEIRREEKSLERLVYKPRTDAVYRALENYSDD